MSVRLATRIAAVQAGGNAVFADLKPGDLFHFPKRSDVIYVKLRGGWFRRSPAGHVYRTGPGTAVVRVLRA